ncbi:MAG: ABC transporter ATP-binding protein [Dehalococcoidia bacterium]|nr:ABC transporter ATP-binding protein [Dehalococcoidia bacterium]
MDALRVERLVKHYGEVRALRGVDLQVAPGEIFGFLGPNGAGKSTAIRIILDLIRPTSGHVEVMGLDAQRQSVAARRCLGYLPSDPSLPRGMTASEVFDFYSDVREERPDRAYLDSLVERFSLDTTRDLATLSRGNRQKVGLILALMHRPPLVMLDEPTTGLDPLVQEQVDAVLHEVAAEGRTVFFSSHILAEVEALCSRAAIVRDGLIVDVFDLAEQRRLAPRRIEVRFVQPPPGDAFDALPPGVQVVERDTTRATLEAHDGIDGVVKFLARYPVDDLTVRQPTLEELFVDYYREEAQ